MNYKKLLEIFSNELLNLSAVQSDEINTVLDSESVNNISVYKNNYFSHAFEILIKDYSTVYKYLGEKNFKYFTRLMLLENKITFSNISDFSKLFPKFLVSKYNIHQDDIVDSLANIDSLLSFSDVTSCTAKSGVLYYWHELTEVQKPDVKRDDYKIDLSKQDTIGLAEIDNSSEINAPRKTKDMMVLKILNTQDID